MTKADEERIKLAEGGTDLADEINTLEMTGQSAVDEQVKVNKSVVGQFLEVTY